MPRRFLLILCLVLLAGQGMAEAAPLKNVLAGHASPYLALHGQDPVAWQEWNADTLTLAKRENKLLFVSVGYFSCHWCHVMQKESYRDPAIAALLNEHFIPVKVDRELNGALDAALIEFSKRLSGAAGWPLNAFVTPEGYPAYSVLYLPPANFSRLLGQINKTWRTQGRAFAQAAREAGAAPVGPPATLPVTAKAVERRHEAFVVAAWRQADTLQGGFQRVSKFPMPAHLAALLEAYARERDANLGEFLRLTLDHMARLGLRDHVNGGFFRYTVDPDWTTPHFEKMLYDNAQLAQLFGRAAAVFQRPDYEGVAHDTLDFMLSGLGAPGGGFYTALSALDRRGREGGGYLWSVEDLRQRLNPAEFALASRIWGLGQAPASDLGYLPQEKVAPTPAEETRLQAILAKLKAAGRVGQVPVDTKINAGLNGLALSALSLAGKGVPRYEQAARKLRDYLARDMVAQGRLLKTRSGTRVFADAELEDYAFVAAGLADYARVFADADADKLARELVRQAWQRFFTPAGWRRGERPLLATLRPEPALADGALPSPSARLMEVTWGLMKTRAEPGLATSLAQAQAMLLPGMAKAPFDHPSALAVLHGP
jgi:uncharacterized protein YyaL (SSP411 family)